MKLIFDNRYATFYALSPELPNSMLCYWKGFYQLKNPELIIALNYCLDCVKEQQIKVIISEHSELEVMPLETIEYLNNVWYKEIVNNGLQVEIYIDSKELTGQLAIEEMYDQVGRNYKELLTPKVETIEEGRILAKKFIDRIQSEPEAN